MSSNVFPFGADTLAVPAYLVSDENDPAYLAWLAEHPDAFAAGTWTSPPRRPRPVPPNVGKSRLTYVDPDAGVPTLDLAARSDLSVQEFMQIAAAARKTGAPRSPESQPSHGEPHRSPAAQDSTASTAEQRNIDDLATVMYNEARGQRTLGMTITGLTLHNRMLRNGVLSVREVWRGYATSRAKS